MGLWLVVEAGCVSRVVKPGPEEPIFGPGVMKFSEARLIQERPSQSICSEILQLAELPKATSTPMGSAKQKETPQQKQGVLYYALTDRQCQALAAAHAVWGNILDEESELLVPLVRRQRTPRARSAALQSDLLRYAALAERNRAAADALELFYRLAEAEAHWDLCQAALDLIAKARAEKPPGGNWPVSASDSPKSAPAEKEDSEIQSSPNSPLSEPLASESLEQALQRWQNHQAELNQKIEDLNSQLRAMLGADLGECGRIWPTVTIWVKPETLDVETAVQQGLDQRAELRALRRLLRGIDANDLSAVRRALEQWHPALGATPSRFPAVAQWLGTAPQHMEAATRQLQIRFLLAYREKEVEEQIRQKARQLQTALAELIQAQARYQAAVRVSGQKIPAGHALSPTLSSQPQTPSPISLQLAIYEAQTALVSRVVAWRIAEVRLMEAMGILARQTGYPLPEEAWQPTDL
ncbi:MAG: hypothetical protein NZ602_16460 [Thermoguttaceae bacterium]|nr:hypothetical protein [Thermoguttaceae bacterium]MDW8038372.1 hypothetical protein [Thermoguttaceae bacterium]